MTSAFQDQARVWAVEMGHDDFAGSNGWLSSWLRRHRISLQSGTIPPDRPDISDESLDGTGEIPKMESGVDMALLGESSSSEAAQDMVTPMGLIEVQRSSDGGCSYKDLTICGASDVSSKFGQMPENCFVSDAF